MQELYWLDFRGYWPIKPLPTSMGRTLTSPAQFIIIFLPLVSACTYNQGLESKTIYIQPIFKNLYHSILEYLFRQLHTYSMGVSAEHCIIISTKLPYTCILWQFHNRNAQIDCFIQYLYAIQNAESRLYYKVYGMHRRFIVTAGFILDL